MTDRFEPPAHWAPPTLGSEPIRLEEPAAVEDPTDVIDVEASPAAWLSPRTLLILTIAIGALLVATVVIGLLYWITPPMQAISVPLVPRA